MATGAPTASELHKVFQKYAGDKFTLTKKDAKTMVEKEMPELYEKCKKMEAGKKILQNMEENEEDELTFKAFEEIMANVIVIVAGI
ncbi:protein S100-A10-like [Pseudophryne corroboree]|uniref:protein S100-A10-like n=1 Tax=Pseudophryne corroboree TaxID=495146 RepID=UPI003081B281